MAAQQSARGGVQAGAGGALVEVNGAADGAGVMRRARVGFSACAPACSGEDGGCTVSKAGNGNGEEHERERVARSAARGCGEPGVAGRRERAGESASGGPAGMG